MASASFDISQFSDLDGLVGSSQLPTLIGSPRTFAGDVVHAAQTNKPDVTPLRFQTTAGLYRENQIFTHCTNGGFAFHSDGGGTLYDDIMLRGWNLNASFNPEYNPAYPSWYDSMESGFLLSDGTIRGEMNLDGFAPIVDGVAIWPARRWRGFSFDRATGHGNWIVNGDFLQLSNNSQSFIHTILGAYPGGQSIPPYGVSEVEATSGGTGYTNGTGYALAFSGGGGTGAAGNFDVVGGAVTNCSITTAGSGYTTNPTVSFAAAGAGTGAVASVLIGASTFRLPVAFVQPASAPKYLVQNQGEVYPEFLLGATNGTTGDIYGGYNLTEVAGAYKHLVSGPTSGVAYAVDGTISWYTDVSSAAGTTIATPKMHLGTHGSLTLNFVTGGTGLQLKNGASVLFSVDPDTGYTKIGTGTGSGDSNSGLDVAIGAHSSVHVLGSGNPSFHVVSSAGVEVILQSASSVFGVIGTASNHDVHFYTNGTTAATLDTSGNLKLVAGLGLYGTAPTTKQTVSGSRGSNAALASLLTALAIYGWITDSTT